MNSEFKTHSIIKEFIYNHCFVPRYVNLNFKESDCDLYVLDYNQDSYITVHCPNGNIIYSAWFREKQGRKIPYNTNSGLRHRLDGPAVISNTKANADNQVSYEFYIKDIHYYSVECFMQKLVDKNMEISENLLFSIGHLIR